jgi:photosystem II stability/assembly factor-like uncharacterized protein
MTAWLRGVVRVTLSALAAGLVGCHSDAPAGPPPPPPPAAPGWAMVNAGPESPGQHFMDTFFLTQDEGWVVGIPGDVYHTANGGGTWDLRHNSPSDGAQLFRAVAFITPTHGWVGDVNFFTPVPHRAIWETHDGGRTFTDISTQIIGPEPVGICGLWKVDASTIYGVGRWNGPAIFIKTTDGGVTWHSMNLAPLLTGAVDVYFFDQLHGLVVGGRGVGNTPAEQASSRTVVIMTSDGGATWSERYVGSTTGHWAWKISFPTSLIGYVATQGGGADHVTIKTIDGGLTWSELPVVTTELGFSGAGFVSPTLGWIGGETGAFETADGGTSWQKVAWAGEEAINRFRILSNGAAVAVGKHIFRYTPPN